MKTKLINREIAYQGKIITVAKDTIAFEDGSTATWDMVLHNGAAAVVPITREKEVLMVRQYRNAADGEVLEIPAGKLEKGEDPMECAVRELEEETGYKGKHFRKICSMYTAIGFSDEKLHLYLATDLEKGVQNLDEDEYISIQKIPLEKAIEMIYKGDIQDSKTIVGLLAVQQLLSKEF